MGRVRSQLEAQLWASAGSLLTRFDRAPAQPGLREGVSQGWCAMPTIGRSGSGSHVNVGRALGVWLSLGGVVGWTSVSLVALEHLAVRTLGGSAQHSWRCRGTQVSRTSPVEGGIVVTRKPYKTQLAGMQALGACIDRSFGPLAQRFLDYAEKNPSRPYKVYHLIVNNATRWLLQYHMIKRALRRREILEDLCDDELKAFRQSGRPDKDLPLCLQPESHLTTANWGLLQRMCELLSTFNEVLEVLEGDGKFCERVDGTIKAYGLI